MIDAYDYSQLNPGDFVLVTGSKAWTSYRLGVITKVKSHSVDAIIFLDGGLEYRSDLWHEDDPRLRIVKEGATFHRGIFKETETCKAIKKAASIAGKVEQLEASLGKLQELIRGLKGAPQENRGHVDRETRTSSRG